MVLGAALVARKTAREAVSRIQVDHHQHFEAVCMRWSSGLRGLECHTDNRFPPVFIPRRLSLIPGIFPKTQRLYRKRTVQDESTPWWKVLPVTTPQTTRLNSKVRHSSRTRTRLTIVLAVSGAALLAIWGAKSSERHADARVALPPIATEAGSASTPNEYFPAQYRNNAQHGLPEQHIQGFWSWTVER